MHGFCLKFKDKRHIELKGFFSYKPSRMETHSKPVYSFDYRTKITELHQAMLYVYDEADRRLPVSLLHDFEVDGDGNLSFATHRLPITAGATQQFAAELHFYQKGIPYNVRLFGSILSLNNATTNLAYFKVHHAEFHGEEDKTSKYSFLKRWGILKYLMPQQQQQAAF